MARFGPEVHELNDHIESIIRRMRLVDAPMSAQPGSQLSRQEMYVVERLGSRGACIMSDLAKYLSVAVNTVTTLIDGMEKKDLVRRERDETNRRRVWLHLTKLGQQCYGELQSLHLQTAEALIAPLTPEEREIYLVLMRKISRAISHEG